MVRCLVVKDKTEDLGYIFDPCNIYEVGDEIDGGYVENVIDLDCKNPNEDALFVLAACKKLPMTKNIFKSIYRHWKQSYGGRDEWALIFNCHRQDLKKMMSEIYESYHAKTDFPDVVYRINVRNWRPDFCRKFCHYFRQTKCGIYVGNSLHHNVFLYGVKCKD